MAWAIPWGETKHPPRVCWCASLDGLHNKNQQLSLDCSSATMWHSTAIYAITHVKLCSARIGYTGHPVALLCRINMSSGPISNHADNRHVYFTCA